MVRMFDFLLITMNSDSNSLRGERSIGKDAKYQQICDQ